MKHRVLFFNCFLLTLLAGLSSSAPPVQDADLATSSNDSTSNPSLKPTTQDVLLKDIPTVSEEPTAINTEESQDFIKNGAIQDPNLSIPPEPSNDNTTDVPTTEITTVTDSTTDPTTTTPTPKPTTTPDPKTTTTQAPDTTTPAPAPTPAPTPETTTPAPSTTEIPVTTVTPEPNVSTTVAPEKPRRFDGASFIGGMILAIGLMCIGLVAWKFYRARTERNYHTL
uniref:Putative integumentary mucin a.1 serrata n=1 Tax=Xenopsylla cheopis TaxID=163159 RepID=A0A6M2DYK0_XENCH